MSESIERTRYDYIVCGAGSAGSVVAGELAANLDVTVLLIEAGGSDDAEAVLDPNAWLSTLGSERDWRFITEPNPHLNGRAIPYSMGKTLGGGGSINVGVWSRGHKEDWDYFASASGDPAWRYDAILDVYRRIEHKQRDDDARDSVSGPMWVQPAQDPHPFFGAALESMSARGIGRFDEMSGQLWEEPNGCAFVDEIVHDGRRQSPYRSFVYPRRHQSNLTVLTGATLARVIFEDRRAVGVEFDIANRRVTARATLEIVLSLGALHTPKVLMQSGIGDETKLSKFEIPLVQHLPGVGRNMHDHVAIGCSWESSGVDMPSAPRGQAVCFWKTEDSGALPNALAFAIPIVYVTPENREMLQPPSDGWSLFAGLATEGRGELHLTGPQPSDPLRIETNFMSGPDDVRAALDVIEMCRNIGNGDALRPFAKREILPGKLGASELVQFVRNGIGTFWHQSGAARMGRDEGSVVDAQLAVYGVEGLRVADASIMPRVTVGNTMAPCVVIGQRAADIIRTQHRS